MNQVLSQDEINSLLRGLSDSDAADMGDSQIDDPSGARRFDLANQERIVRGRMPTMELIHDRFSRQFRVHLAKFLGRQCFANVGTVEMLKFGAFLKKLPLPSSLHIIRMPPLAGNALVVVSAPLVFSIVESLFGGTGANKVKIEGREYTPIETKLIGRVVTQSLELLREAWAPIHPVDFVFVRSEYNPLAVGIVPATDVVIVVTIDIEIESENATLIIATPYSMLEPIRAKLSTSFQASRLEVDTGLLKRMEGNIRQTTANLTVQLAVGSTTPREFLQLKKGDILPLSTSPADESMILIEGEPKFYGNVGSFRGNRAVKISRTIPKRDLINYRNRLGGLINGG